MSKESLLEALKVIASGRLYGKELSKEELMKFAEKALNNDLETRMKESRAYTLKLCQELNIDHNKLNSEGGIMAVDEAIVNQAVKKYKGNLTETSKYLKISRATLSRKVKEYKIKLTDF